IEGVDRKERVHRVGLDPETLYEPLGLQHLKLGLVLDAGKCFGGRLVVGGLEDAAEQNRHIFEFHAGALFDCRDRLVTEKGIGAADIEHELRRRLGQGGLPGFSAAAVFWRIMPENTVAMPNSTELQNTMWSNPCARSSTAASIMKKLMMARENR